MLQIKIPANEFYDEQTNLFISTKETTLCLEHSLISISKWEQKFHKPFIKTVTTQGGITDEQWRYYVQCMTITQNVDPLVYSAIDSETTKKILDYIEDPMTATTFNDRGKKPGKAQVVTSELIYFWMINFGIPFECEKWHLNRLLTLIKTCDVKNGPRKKKSKSETLQEYAAINKARRAAMHSKG